jgi:hypothetical protein
MKIRMTPGFLLSFFSLSFLMHEAHEIAHTLTGRFICGCWGHRDFNYWALCQECSASSSLTIMASVAGPLFTYLMIWIGAVLIRKSQSEIKRIVGLCLIFANLPFGRILTALLKGGDEILIFNSLMQDSTTAWIMGIILALAVTSLPLYTVYKFMNNKKWFWFFFIVPVVVNILMFQGLLNTLAKSDLLSEVWILGSPMIVTLWTFLVALVFVFSRNRLYDLKKEANSISEKEVV